MSVPAVPSPSVPVRQLPGRPGVTLEEVLQAADAVLRRGLRPTIDRVRQELGRGSPNTINPHLDEWWARLGQRLQAGPAALHRLPESVLCIVEGLYVQLLEEARRQAHTEQGAARQAVDQAKSDLQLRSHVLSLRESELEKQLLERTRSLDTLQAQVSGLATLLAQANAGKDSAERRAAALETELKDLRERFAQVIAKAVAARRRAAAQPASKKSAPARALPTRRTRASKPPKRARKPARKTSTRKSK